MPSLHNGINERKITNDRKVLGCLVKLIFGFLTSLSARMTTSTWVEFRLESRWLLHVDFLKLSTLISWTCHPFMMASFY